MIAILTEADQKVATGHLIEAIELARELISRDEEALILINSEFPLGLLERIPCKYECYTKESIDCFIEIKQILARIKPAILITDMRELLNDQIAEIKTAYKGPIVCIDEWGHRALDADIIINPMIDPFYWEYPGLDSKGVYRGAEYLILPAKLQDYIDTDRHSRDKVQQICVSMGGADLKGTALKLVAWLPQILPNVQIVIIAGAAFTRFEELDELIKASGNGDRITVKVNVEKIYKIFLDSDIVFCAGGNTLHELACLGVPSIIIPTMPHEKKNGEKFESYGFGKCLSLAEEVDMEEVKTALNELLDNTVREKMSIAGRTRFDGKGLSRTVNIVLDEMKGRNV